MNKERKERLGAAIQRASESIQVALILDASLAGEPIDLSAEKGDSGWRFGWRWDLGERDLGDVVKQLFPFPGLDKSPLVGLEDIKLRSIYAEYFSGTQCKGLSFGIADLSVLYVQRSKTAEQKAATCWGLAHEKPIALPTSGVVAMLIGKELTLSDLRVGSVSGFTQEMRSEVIGQLAQARLLLGSEGEPPTGFVAGVTIGGIGANPIAVPFVGRPAENMSGSSPVSGSAVNAAGGGPPAESVDSTDGTCKWFVVGKTIGPLRLGRVGCEWKDGKIGLLLDSAVDVGGLHFGLTGLCVRLPPSDPKPTNLELDLDGIDLSYRGGPISISGSFLKSEITVQGQKTTQYDGMALIQAADFTITGFGSCAEIAGQASLFIFAILHRRLAGPPCFRVNGLAAGFGYNHKLTLPPIEEVYNFPLVRAALEPNYFDSGPGNALQDAMGKLQKFIPRSLGDYWCAIGIRFSSFEMIQAFALLSVSFGNEVEIGLLGLASVTIPKGLKPGEALAYAELALRVVIKPAEGTIKMEARLTDESYVFDKNCHLTGGFAFYIWFGGPLAGDFVLTLGGYHPKFLRPSHYPIVPRLGINWQVTKEMTITAGMYFALTPSCLMAGGKLSAVYQSPGVKVWFIVYADFLLSWKPFYYSIDIGISLGIEVDLGAIVISLHLGAELHLWGPEFAGLVQIDLTVILITVSFGPDKQLPPPLTAQEFVESFLPPPPTALEGSQNNSNVIVAQINSGLIREETQNETVLRVVNAHGLTLTTQSLIPVSNFTGLQPQDAGTSSPPQLGIRSMGKTELRSSYKVTLIRVRDSQEVGKGNMRILLVKTAVPDALWGKSHKEGEVSLPQEPEAIMLQAWVGMRISFDPIHPQGALPAMAIEQFAYETFNKPIPWNDQLKVAETIAAIERKEIWTVMDSVSTQSRSAILAVLARESPFDLNTVGLSGLSEAGEAYFQANPEICRLGSAFV